MALSGTQFEALVNALGDAYSMSDFRKMLKFRLDKDIEDIALDGDKQDRIFAVIEDAEHKGWTSNLIKNAHEYNPGNPELSEFVRTFGYSSVNPADGNAGLQRLVTKSSKYQRISELVGRLSEIEAQVCRIAYQFSGNKKMRGTGFLVGPDLLLTNHHVIGPLKDGLASPDNVECLFDYRELVDGTTLDGEKFNLKSDDWEVDSSPHSNADVTVNGGTPEPDRLDYALLRLSEMIGDMPIGDKPNGGAKRGWIDMCAEPPEVVHGTVMTVLQHPDGQPQLLAYGSVLQYNENHTRIRYDATTEGGSSGSPCFTADFELFGLHHAGDPNFDELHSPEFNQCVPIRRIVEQMRSRQVGICQSG